MTPRHVSSLVITALIATALPSVITSSAQAAPAPTITIGSDQLVSELPFVDPIYVGYKGTQSFIPKAVAAKKDKRGCRMKGGMWESALGSKVTQPASLIIGPVMSYKDAWGQGACAWTPGHA